MSKTCASRGLRRSCLTTSGIILVALACPLNARAQTLDMDAPTAAPPKAAPVLQSGGLDMDVSPPSPPQGSVAPVQATTGQGVQDGVAPLNAKSALDAPTGTQPASTSPSSVMPVSTAPASDPPASGPASTSAPVAPMVLDSPPSSLASAPLASAPLASSPQASSPQAEPPPVVLDHPKVLTTATLQAGDATVTLFGIEGIAGESAQGLQGYLAAEAKGPLTCQVHMNAGFVCLMTDGTDIAQVALLNGAARTKPDAPDAYREQEVDAQNARRGIWVNLPPPPETIKHPVVRDTATLAAAGKTYILDGVVGFQAPYNGQLQGYIAASGDAATCSPQGEPGRFVCLLPDGTDIAKAALVNGAARVDSDAPDAYRVQQLDALNNRRGYWATASSADVNAALIAPAPTGYVLVPGDDGSDGITYVGGAPVIQVDGGPAFLIYGDDELGWGYYDHYHHWHGAPDRYRNHMEHFHPEGRGLRGYGGEHYGRDREEAIRRDGPLHREELARREESVRRGEDVRREGAGPRGQQLVRREEGPSRAEMPRGVVAHPGAGAMGHPGMPPGHPEMGHPEMGHPEMGHPEMGHPEMGHPEMAHPGMAPQRGPAGGGGFMRPTAMASAGGFHPGAPVAAHPAAAPHPAAPAPTKHK